MKTGLLSCYREFVLLSLLLGSQAYSFIPSLPSISATELDETFKWNEIEPQHKLRYTPCYDGLECARLLVPLDWNNPGSEPWQQVALAVVRLPATVNQSDPQFGGTIVLNPGGPSGSGVDLVRRSASGIQEIVDGEKHFEILAFDPRGTKYTTPTTACFPQDADRDRWTTHSNDAGSVDDGPFSLSVKWALVQGLGQLCDQTNLGVFPDGSNIRQYVSTLQVAYDLVRLTEVIDEELENATARARAQGQGPTDLHAATPPPDQTVLVNARVPLLNYWGYSYGTFLGNTFASMFPNRIGRIILDGVVDSDDYSAAGWLTNLQDNHRVWEFFFQWCFEAGPACALYDPTFQNASDIEAEFKVFASFLQDNPLSVVHDGRVYILTYFGLQKAMHSASYGPYQLWPRLAAGIQQVVKGDYAGFHANISFFPFFPSTPPLLENYNILDPFDNLTSRPSGYPHVLEAQTAILCGDGDDISSDTKADFLDYVSELKNQSALVGPSWAQITLLCRHWPKSQRPLNRNRFTGPFGSQLQDYQDDGRSSPILFIGNTADPVTPLRNAVKMSRLHEGSKVLIQNSPGHCSGVSIPSNCTWTAISDFFNYGSLPENGTRCEIDAKPWDPVPPQFV
ncbi:hypothetical protein DV735_g4689, partial [Chaetothyriales sp. CBS 134920]